MAPHPSPTASYWTRSPISLSSPASTPASFQEPPIVIIGAGITAVSTAYALLPLIPTAHLLVLDARSICDGATGRNGGHCKAVPHDELARLTTRFGPKRAVELVRFQMRHLESLKEICELVDGENGADKTEFREVETVDLYVDKDLFAEAKTKVEVMRKVMPDVEVKVRDADDARRHFGVSSHCHGAISYKAGALYPYRLVMGVWSHLLKEYPSRLTIVSNTPVTSIATGSKAPFLVHTSKGVYPAQHIIHATNAYASHLVPSLRDRILPVRAHMTSQCPGPNLQRVAGGRSWSVIYPGAFDYATQRPGPGGHGDLLVGGGLIRSASGGADAIGVFDDSDVDREVIRYLEGVFPTLFESRQGGGAADLAWSGIIGFTSDGLPLVGRLDTRGGTSQSPAGKEPGPAEWVSAGYNGEGMVFAFLSGAALAAHVAGREFEELPRRPGIPGGRVSEWFPAELYVTKERLRGDVRRSAEEALSGLPAAPWASVGGAASSPHHAGEELKRRRIKGGM